MNSYRATIDFLFPEVEIFHFKLTFGKKLLLFFGLSILFSFAGMMIPANGLVGFDWVNFWGQRRVPPFYPPWTEAVIKLLSWPALVGITLASVATSAIARARHMLSVTVVFFTLPVLWTVFLGQLEGLVVLGLLGLPWLTPLALVKPQVSIFAFGAKKSFLVALFVFLLISVVIWGFWPSRTLNTNQYYEEGRYVDDISLGLWGAFIAIPLFFASRGDMDMLMLAGVFMTPHLIPYNLLPVVPAIARLKPGSAIIALILSWLPFSANWIGNNGWWLGWIFVLWLWTSLALDRRRIQLLVGKKGDIHAEQDGTT